MDPYVRPGAGTMAGPAVAVAERRDMIRRWKSALRWMLYSPSERRHSLVGSPARWKMKREFQIRFLRDRGLEPGHHLLDLGCGTLRGGIPLIGYLEPGHYFGIDVRQESLKQARKELAEAGLTGKSPTLLHAPELGSLRIGRVFDYVWAFSVLIHLTDEILESVLVFVREHIDDTGQFFANVNVDDRPGGRWLEFPVVFRSLQFYRRACERNDLELDDLGALGQLGHVSGDALQDRQRMLRIRRVGDPAFRRRTSPGGTSTAHDYGT